MHGGIGAKDRKQENLLDAIYRRLMLSRADEISRLKAEMLSRQLRDREFEIHRLEFRKKEIRLRYERFMNACIQESMQRVARVD